MLKKGALNESQYIDIHFKVLMSLSMLPPPTPAALAVKFITFELPDGLAILLEHS